MKGALAAVLLGIVSSSVNCRAHAQTNNPTPSVNEALINALIKKGVLTEKEAEGIKAEVSGGQPPEMAPLSALKWNLPTGIKNITLFGDARLRYEYRSASNPQYLQTQNQIPQNSGPPPLQYSPLERFRYALRFGIRGDASDDFSFGFRLETGANPRSPWVTFGNNNNPKSATPSDKTGSGINVGQLYIDWHPSSWLEMNVGRMPMPLYTTPMLWDTDINPEGAFEKVNADIGPVNVFVDFAQFDYQAATTSTLVPSGDIFVLAWQAGVTWNIDKGFFAKIAPVVYSYTGTGTFPNTNFVLSGSAQSQLYGFYTGQNYPNNTTNAPNGNFNNGNLQSGDLAFNEYGINNLTVLEIPAEIDFPIRNTFLGNLQGRLFGDYAYNLDGHNRAKNAFTTYNAGAGSFGLAPLGQSYSHDVKAYQIGLGIGSEGPTYGPTHGIVYGNISRRNAWEGRVYWQHIEQYALDVNLLDSDFFEGRANMEGIYGAFAFAFTDAVVATARYGYAQPIERALATGGNNLDLPNLNPVQNYHLFQLDLSVRF